MGLVGENEQEKEYSKKVLMICVLSILLTAPLGAILITLTGKLMLTKTIFPETSINWRSSNRPSIRHIIIMKEDNVKDFEEENDNTSSAYTLNKEVVSS